MCECVSCECVKESVRAFVCVSRLLLPLALPQPALADVPVSIKVSLVDFYSKSLQTAGPKRVCVREWVCVGVCTCVFEYMQCACLPCCLSVCLATAAVICQARRQGNQAIKQLTPDCVCLCVRVPVCVCVRARVRATTVPVVLALTMTSIHIQHALRTARMTLMTRCQRHENSSNSGSSIRDTSSS